MDKPNDQKEEIRQQLRQAALQYHEFPTPGKISVTPTKQLTNQRDLALAYTPGVAAACEEIVVDPANAFRYTARGNLVAVITNGTAVLGLGDIGPLAAKPVMEGKGVLFKKFAGIDVFDIEVNEKNLDKLIDLIAALEPTFGGINLEDIKAPDCFYVERALRSRMKIPVFHDDQHGTAIVVGAGVLNALTVSGKQISEVKLVTSGAGAAALACLGLLVKLGIPRENIWVTDLAGVVYKGRTELMDEDKIVFAQDTPHRTLAEVIAGADIFLGLSAAGVLKPEMVARMAPRPVIFAFAEGEEERVLRAVQVVVDENLARPTLIGRPEVIKQRIAKFGLRLAESDYDLVNTENDHRYRTYWQMYQEMTARKGVTAQLAKIEMRRRLTLIGAMLLKTGEVDGMLCGTWGSTAMHLSYIDQVIGLREGAKTYAAMNCLLLPGRQVMLVDTHVNYDPTAEQVAEITVMAAEEMLRFGIKPKAALLSHSNYGTSNMPSAVKMREALALLQARAAWLEVDGEMHGDTALDGHYRHEIMPSSPLTGEANLLVLPNIDAANISYNLLKNAAGGGIAIGPVLLGAALPVHILTPSATVRRIINMTALAVADANAAR